MGQKAEIKKVYLREFHRQWKAMLSEQFADKLEELRKADMRNTAEQMWKHPAVKLACKGADISVDDIEKALNEVREEILA